MQSPHFECEKSKDGDGRSYHVVIYFHGLIARGLPDIPDIPEGYSIGDWARSEHKLMTRSSFCGAVICPHCGVRQKHELVWPDQAYFQISYRNHTLWAFNRQSAIELCAYINATNRDRSDYEYWPFLMKIPHVFQTKGARDTVVRRLKKRLERRS